MAEVYANLQVPALIRKQVEEILKDLEVEVE